MEELILQFGYLTILLGSAIEGNAFVILGEIELGNPFFNLQN
jgi:hypothetical protein